MKRTLPILLFLVACGGKPSDDNNEVVQEEEQHEIHEGDSINWLPFTADVFDRAAEEQKLVFLEVGANWCHWCHVMDEKTYSDAEIQSYLDENFILCREDQDSRPDLYAAYKPYGWPAIIAFDSQKNEVMRLKGYQEKSKFLKLLTGVVNDPSPLPNEAAQPSELSASNQELFNKFLARLDHEKGMYNWNHKYLHLPGILHGLRYYKENDSLKTWTDKTVKNSFQLVDPVWSGVYQYSAKRSWNNQHYEKLLRVQAAYVEGYSKYSLLSGDPRAQKLAKNIVNYCEEFLSPGEAVPLYFNSQNADVELGKESTEYYNLQEDERKEIGVPSVDEHIYLKENAMMAKAITYLYFATGWGSMKFKSQNMTDYILENFNQFKGIYNRNEVGQMQLSFEDNRQLLELLMLQYQAFGEAKYLETAETLGKNVIREFDSEGGMRATSGGSPLASPIVQFDNLNAVLTFNFLGHLTGEDLFIEHAQSLYAKLDKAELIKTVGYIPLLLRAEQELIEEPYHAVLITDQKDKDASFAYFKEIVKNGNPYIIFDLAVIGSFTEEQEMLYGGMEAGTLFMCTSSFCSAPIYEVSGLQEFLNSN